MRVPVCVPVCAVCCLCAVCAPCVCVCCVCLCAVCDGWRDAMHSCMSTCLLVGGFIDCVGRVYLMYMSYFFCFSIYDNCGNWVNQ